MYYYRIFLLSKGWIIPTKVKRKQCPEYIALQKNPLECRFDIESIGKDEYYGFEVDGDSLCLLEDFTIFHNCPNLQKALDVTLSNTESGAISVGTIRVYGTGGTKGANWAAFSKAFYNPKMNKMLCMENVWDVNKRHEVCGFFFPQVWIVNLMLNVVIQLYSLLMLGINKIKRITFIIMIVKLI